jgi:hypothetical protein
MYAVDPLWNSQPLSLGFLNESTISSIVVNIQLFGDFSSTIALKDR